MKQLYIFKTLADKAMADYSDAYELSTCDVNSLDCGSCVQADTILSTAMGETNCYRDSASGEIICAWWQDDDVYEGVVEGHSVAVTCAPDGSISVDVLDNIDEDEAQAIYERF